MTIPALAAAGAASCKPAQQQVNFSDLPNNSILPGPAIPDGYHGLSWRSFIIANQDIENTTQPQIVPSSPVNYAASISATQVLAGSIPLITTIYPNSSTSSFTLQSFSYGCAINLGQGVVGLPAPCLISVTGYRGTSTDLAAATEVCSHQYYFDSNPLKAEVMQHTGVIEGCSGLQFATFVYTNTGVGSVANVDTGLTLDDLKYTTCG